VARQSKLKFFLQDIQKGHPLVLDPSEFITLFGNPTNEDMNLLTQSFFIQYHRVGMSVDTLFDRWGGDWIFEILLYCEKEEEYELCSILKDIFQEWKEGIRPLKGIIENA